ncbi:MAG TPA: hypothetical protein VJ623_05805 [Holophagaceae bacterium]|nr:hypothetical protein [Holophagaceae bacterium]
MAEAFKALGYDVDVVNFDFAGKLDWSRYQAVMGAGAVLLELFKEAPEPFPKTILYSPGVHNHVQNLATLRRVAEVRDKRGKWLLESGRFQELDLTALACIVDGVAVVGNEVAARTYRDRTSRPVCPLPLFFHPVLDGRAIARDKDYARARREVLWFGSTGLIHKGLDLALEAFVQRPEWTLHVCGPLSREPRFVECYKRELTEFPNIRVHGFLDLNGDTFRDLMTRCAFTLLASCSEGGAGGIVAASGNGGLMPLVSREVSTDVGDFGWELRDLSTTAILEMLDFLDSVPEQELRDRALAGVEVLMQRHDLETYRAALRGFMGEILSS